jgi:N-acetyl-anhydromuramyl-L-alanine amidase AmpD
MQFIRARNFTPAEGRAVNLVVIHTMEAPEKPTTAENVAAWFAGDSAPKASVHYCVDVDSVVQTLEEKHVAWGAPGANEKGIHIEHAGYAKQTPEEWADVYSRTMLERSAELVAGICVRHKIPVRRLTVAELRDGERGIVGHADVSDAFKASTHWDPGPSFPWTEYLDRVKAHVDAMTPATSPAPAPDGDDIAWVRVGGYLVAPRPIPGVSLEEAVALAKQHGCELPTPGLVDAIWKAADLKLAPITRTTPHMTQEEMSAPKLLADQAARIEAQLGGRSFRLLAGTHKDVVRGPDGKVGIYGWHRLNGEPIQGPTPYFGHAMSWRDYSQGLRLCKRDPAAMDRPTERDVSAVLEQDGGASRRAMTSEAVVAAVHADVDDEDFPPDSRQDDRDD